MLVIRFMGSVRYIDSHTAPYFLPAPASMDYDEEREAIADVVL